MKKTTLRLSMENKDSRYESKNLLKLKNGYVLEFNINKPRGWQDEKIIFSVFFNEFSDHYVAQEFREYLLIRRDKDRGSTKNPYIKEIFQKSDPEEEIFKRCFKCLEELVERDTITEKSFDRKEIHVDKSVQNYLYEDLHTYLSEPIFNWSINRRKKQ